MRRNIFLTVVVIGLINCSGGYFATGEAADKAKPDKPERYRNIERPDGTRSEHFRDKSGDHRVRDIDRPADGRNDRTYGENHTPQEVREKEHDKNPQKP